jgi:hypothetical protein
MKTSKRVLCLIMAMVMLLALSVTAAAKTSSEEIDAPDKAAVVFTIQIGTRSVNFTWADINGKGQFKTQTGTYGAKVDGELTTQEWTGISLADMLGYAEKQLGIKLKGDYKISAVAADGYKVSFTVADARDESNNYIVAADPVSNSDEEHTYANSYARILRGDAETMSNQANIRCLTGLEITDSNDKAIKLSGKTAGGDVENSVFYIAVKEAAGSSYKFYYYTREELESYDNIYNFDYTDHSVDKVVAGRGAALKNLLADITDSTITGDMIIQYAESDGYHADAAAAIEDSAYKDKVEWLDAEHVTAGGETAAAVETVICYDSWTTFDNPDKNNVNSTKWEDADAGSGYLRAYRQRDDANSAVIKTLMGVVVSYSGQEFTGKDGYTLKAQSVEGDTMRIIEPSTGKAYTSQKITGLVPGMKYAVSAPEIASAKVSGAKTQVITAGIGTDTEVTFKYQENNYVTVSGKTYTLSSFEASDRLTTTPSADEILAHGTPYGYYGAMYYRYSGVWLKHLVSGDVTVTGTDGKTLEIKAADLDKYFLASGYTASKSTTNVSEGKRFTFAYAAPQLIIPGDGTLVGEKEAADKGNKMVTVAVKAVASVDAGKTEVSFTDVKAGDWFYAPVMAAAEKGLVAGMGDGTYGYNGELTWAQAITFAVRAYEYNNGGVKTVNSANGEWFANFVAAAIEYKMIAKAPANPNATITRGEAAMLFAAAIGDKAAVNEIAEGYFTDVKAGDVFHDAVYKLAKAGICNGMGDGTFGAASSFKRSEVATIVARMCGLVDAAKI